MHLTPPRVGPAPYLRTHRYGTHPIIRLLLALTLSGGCAGRRAIVEADYVFHNVNVVPLNEPTTLRNRTVVVRDGEIVAIADQEMDIDIVGGERIDGGGSYLIPGLADMHVHMRMDPRAMFNLFLANGITTVRNMRIGDGEGRYDHLALRADVAAGDRIGPRYLISGRQITPELLPDVGEVEPFLSRHVAEGYDFLKIHQDLKPEVYDALLEGARQRGLRVVGHLQHQMPLSASLRMDGVEHVEEFLYTSVDGFGEIAGDFTRFLPVYHAHLERMAEPEYRAAIVAEVAASGVYLDPTLIIYKMVSTWADDEWFVRAGAETDLQYLPPDTRDLYLDPSTNPYQARDFPFSSEQLRLNVAMLESLLLELHEAGVPLLLGTDSFGSLVPGFSVHRELELLVGAGLSPYEALRTGTVNVAAYLDDTASAGTVEVGKRADFVLIEGNPLIDIRNTRNVRAVFTRDSWYSESDLEGMLEEARSLVAGK